MNVIHGEVEKHFSLLNDKFSTAKEIGKFGQKSAGWCLPWALHRDY
jgi:hypothetical protein